MQKIMSASAGRLCLLLIVLPYAASFSGSAVVPRRSARTSICMADKPQCPPPSPHAAESPRSSRLGFLRLAAGAALAVVAAPKDSQAIFDGPKADWYRPEGEAGVVPVWTGVEWKGPTWPKPADEPSITWTEFLQALANKEVAVVDFVGKNGEKVYVTNKVSKERIRVGEGLPDETTPPPPTERCAECLKDCPPEDKSCSCLNACGGSNDWNSPLYTAKIVKRAGVPFRHSATDKLDFGNPVNMWRKWAMFDAPISAGLL